MGILQFGVDGLRNIGREPRDTCRKVPGSSQDHTGVATPSHQPAPGERGVGSGVAPRKSNSFHEILTATTVMSSDCSARPTKRRTSQRICLASC